MGKGTLVLLNQHAGRLRGAGMGDAAAIIESRLAPAGTGIEIAAGSGLELQRRLEERLSADPPQSVIVGGGDGTVASAAAQLRDTGIALGILPLGTMNLFARSLGMPLDIDAALTALAGARRRRIDLGEVNGRIFTHHLSIGLQPRLVALRETMSYASRLGKVVAGLWALIITLGRPPRLALRATIDGEVLDLVTPALVVSNNVYGPNHLPYADALDEGVLGIYACTSCRWTDLALLSLEALLGSWQKSGQVKTLTAKSVSIERRGGRRRPMMATLDGELVTLQRPIEVTIRPRALTVLAPESKREAGALV